MTVGGTGYEEGKELVPFTDVVSVVVDQSNGDLLVAGGSGVDVFEPLPFDQYRFVRKLPVGGISTIGWWPRKQRHIRRTE